jgi:hypothetical protein
LIAALLAFAARWSCVRKLRSAKTSNLCASLGSDAAIDSVQ